MSYPGYARSSFDHLCYFLVMRRKSRSAVFLIIGGGLLVILLWAWMRAEETTPASSAGAANVAENAGLPAEETESPNASGLDSAPPEQAQSSTFTTTTEATTPPNSAPGTEKPSTPLSAEQLIVLRDVESNLAAAFAGDHNEAVALSGFLNQCQFTFRDRHRVEQSIARAERSFAEGKPLTQFRPSGPAQQFETLEAFESDQWDTFFRCDAARTLITEDFWDRLEQQADAGNPAARYLFATLMREPPSRDFAFDRWDEDLELREQAREYTWRNLEEREPLGLLALAYSEGASMRFNAGWTTTSGVLVLAAIKCGLSTPELLQSADQILQHVERRSSTQPELLEQLNNASDEARQMFCK
jgi:hypothetical protein